MKTTTPTENALLNAHTQTPWKVGYSDGSGASPEDGYTITSGNIPVVRSGKDDWGAILGIDNETVARLIAAAPELLAALRRICASVDACRGVPNRIKADAVFARAVIAKTEKRP